MDRLPERVRLVIFDLDGVIYRGDEPVPRAADLVGWLRDAGAAVRFATNNSTVTREGYVARLAAMGIPTAWDEVVTSSSATVEHLRRHAPDVRRVLAIGAGALGDELRAAGFETTMAGDVSAVDPGAALRTRFDAVVVGLDMSFDYARLAAGMAAVVDGARLIATNADARFPTASGFLPGAGTIVAALASATGVAPQVIGKPEPAMFQSILEAAGVRAGETVVVGDNPPSDIAGARRTGCASILVLTGVADAAAVERLEGDEVPDAVAAGPADVRKLLARRVSR